MPYRRNLFRIIILLEKKLGGQSLIAITVDQTCELAYLNQENL